MILRYFTRSDIILITVILILSAAGFEWIRQYNLNGKHAVVEVDGSRVLELSLDQDVITTVAGPLGKTVLSVENGSVRIVDSPCPHHYCVRMGPLRHRGEIAVCVPNRVIVSVTGGNDHDSFDGVTQ